MAFLNLFFSVFFLKLASSLHACQESCSRSTQEIIRFPFGVSGGRCNYPGFNLSCKQGQTILTLPHYPGKFRVQYIDYTSQAIFIHDPGFCLAQHFLRNFSLSGSPFVAESYSYTFLNCSSNSSAASYLSPLAREVGCLSSDNFTVVAVLNNFDRGINKPRSVPSSCIVIADRVEVPVPWFQWTEADTSLTWEKPDCRSCEQRGGTCGFKDEVSLDIDCFDLPSDNNVLPRSAKYGLIIGIGIPGLLCIIGVGCYICGRIRTFRHGGNRSRTELTSTFPFHSSMTMSGLDGPTLELYPKTILGASRRLPKPNDNTCPICLSEYQPKETLRTIPECNHYFHADCIDEWLKMNVTCPLCRNSPDISSLSTPSLSLCDSSIAAAHPSSLSVSSSSSSPASEP